MRLLVIFQCLMDCFDHGAWGDGRPGHVVELPAILFHFPAFVRRPGQRLPIEMLDPVTMREFDVIAESRGLLVGEHTHTSERSIDRHPDQKFDLTGIAIGGDGFQHHACRCALHARAVDLGAGFESQLRGRRQIQAIVQQVVVMQASGHHL